MSDRNTRNRDRSSSYRKKPNNFRPNYNRPEGGGSVDKQRKYEEYAWTLAYLSEGSPTDPNPFSQREPVIQAIGEIWFTLLELTPKRGVNTISDSNSGTLGDSIGKSLSHDESGINSTLGVSETMVSTPVVIL